MALQVDYALFAASVAMAFVFGQIPISDAVLSRYVPDQWRAKVLSVKFMLNLVVGALALLAARTILASGGGFESVMTMLAIAACLIILAALVLPERSGVEIDTQNKLPTSRIETVLCLGKPLFCSLKIAISIPHALTSFLRRIHKFKPLGLSSCLFISNIFLTTGAVTFHSICWGNLGWFHGIGRNSFSTVASGL